MTEGDGRKTTAATPKINIRPIGQVPLPPPRQVHVSRNVIGAVPLAAAKGPVLPAVAAVRASASLLAVPPARASAPAEPVLAPTPGGQLAIKPTDAATAPAERKSAKNRPAPPPPPAPHTVRSAAGEVWQDPTLADWDPSTCIATPSAARNSRPAAILDDFRIFVGDLGPDVTDSMLHHAFAPFGSITKTRVIRDKRTHKSRGFGFVGFREPQDFLHALKEMNGKQRSSPQLMTDCATARLRQIHWQPASQAKKEHMGRSLCRRRAGKEGQIYSGAIKGPITIEGKYCAGDWMTGRPPAKGETSASDWPAGGARWPPGKSPTWRWRLAF